MAMTLAEMSERFGIPYPTLLSAVQAGRLPARKRGGLWLVDEGDAETYASLYAPRERYTKHHWPEEM